MVPTAVNKTKTMKATIIINPGINKSSHTRIPPKILFHNNILLSNKNKVYDILGIFVLQGDIQRCLYFI